MDIERLEYIHDLLKTEYSRKQADAKSALDDLLGAKQRRDKILANPAGDFQSHWLNAVTAVAEAETKYQRALEEKESARIALSQFRAQDWR